MPEFSIESLSNFAEPRVAEAFIEAHGGVLFAPQVRHLGNEPAEVLLILDEDKKLFGALQVSSIRLKGVKTLAQPYLHPHCGLFTLPISGAAHAVNSRKKKLMRAVAAYFSSRKERILSIPFAPEWVDVQPLVWAGFSANVKYTYQLSLQSDANIQSLFSTDVRSEVKKAISLGAELTTQATHEEVLLCLATNAAKQGFKFQEHAVRKLLIAQEAGFGKLFVVRHENNIAAVALTLADKQTMYYIMGAAQRDSAVRGALSYALTGAIEYAQKNALNTFDFEGSMIPGVEHFFRGFGGDLKPFYHLTKANVFMRMALRLAGRRDF